MRTFRHYFLTATLWAFATLAVVACGSHGDNSGSVAACTYVNGTCIAPAGVNYGGSVATPPYPSQNNGVISDQPHFANLNTALNGIIPSYYPYGYGLTEASPYNGQYFSVEGYTSGSALVPWTYGINNLQVAIAQISTTANADNSYSFMLYLISPAIVANPGTSTQIFTSLNPYSSIAVQGSLSTVYQSGTTTPIGYVLLVISQVTNNGTVQNIPVAELDITGNVANANMTYTLKYLASSNQPTVAAGTMRKGVDYQ